MTALAEAFIGALGRPDPRVPSGLRFPQRVDQFFWDNRYPEIGAGWYLNGFVYLFGEGLEVLQPCLDAWPFLVPPGRERLILGRNAYGAILVLEDARRRDPPPLVHVLDPLTVSYFSDPNMDFAGLLGHWLPQRQIPRFLDTTIYDAWVKRHGQYLDVGQILAIKAPLGMGGEMTLDNFQNEDIVEYYRTTAPIYARMFAAAKQQGA